MLKSPSHSFQTRPTTPLSAISLRLSKLVSNSLCIANYVRSLHIMIEWRKYVHFNYTRSLNEEDIAMILPKFRMLRKISFDDDTPSTWPLLHERFRAAFIQCLRLPSLIEVSIHGINAFPLCICQLHEYQEIVT